MDVILIIYEVNIQKTFKSESSLVHVARNRIQTALCSNRNQSKPAKQIRFTSSNRLSFETTPLNFHRHVIKFINFTIPRFFVQDFFYCSSSDGVFLPSVKLSTYHCKNIITDSYRATL